MNNLIIAKKIIGWILIIITFGGILVAKAYEIRQEGVLWRKIILGFVLCFIIVGILCLGCWLAF